MTFGFSRSHITHITHITLRVFWVFSSLYVCITHGHTANEETSDLHNTRAFLEVTQQLLHRIENWLAGQGSRLPWVDSDDLDANIIFSSSSSSLCFLFSSGTRFLSAIMLKPLNLSFLMKCDPKPSVSYAALYPDVQGVQRAPLISSMPLTSSTTVLTLPC